MSSQFYGVGLIVLLLIMWAGNTAFGYPNARQGPHGGVIRVPGPFTIEFTASQKGLKIYLLDRNLKNPKVTDSDIRVRIINSHGPKKIICKKTSDHFFCPFDKLPESGKLVVNPTREKIQGKEILLDLPLLIKIQFRQSPSTRTHLGGDA